jgi:C-terminal processing protease CtpA/Prc
MDRKQFYLTPFLALAFCIGLALPGFAQQKMDSVTRAQVGSMLSTVQGAIKKDYYDPTFRGIDIDARFDAARLKLKTAESLGQAYAIIAQAVLDLNDSHTSFSPPARNMIVEYGWRMKVFGNAAYITAIKDGSDAAAKGLKVGDEVLKMNGFRPARADLWKMIYYYQTLNPQLKVALEVKSPAGEVRQLQVDSHITQLKRVMDLTTSTDFNEAVREGDNLKSSYKHYFKDLGSSLIWKMPDFAFDPVDVPEVMGRAAAKQTLILDLRGNPGGYVVTLEKLAGYFFDKDTKIADIKGRKPMKPQMAKTQGPKGFTGKVIVLVDANSASAAEIFARLMQIEKRGIVLGDVSAGAVMQSRGVGFDAGVSTVINYGMNLTMADVIMTDGKSIEHVGVTPDELVVPTGKDLAERNDPVLARALQLAGVNIDAAAAGKIFPVEPFIERRTNIAIDLEF